MHRYHPDPSRGDPEDAILWDDCERCDEHAEYLVSLDDSNAARLFNLVRDVEVAGLPGAHYRTHAEARAGRRIHHVICLIAQATGRTPASLVLSLEAAS